MGSDTRSQQYIPSSDFFNSHSPITLKSLPQPSLARATPPSRVKVIFCPSQSFAGHP